MRLKPGRGYGFVDLVGGNVRVMVGDRAECDMMGKSIRLKIRGRVQIWGSESESQ